MLSKLRILLEAVLRHKKWTDGEPNGLQVANESPCGWSRATTYRWLDKALEMGLIDRFDFGTEYRWFVTAKGYEFLGGWHEFEF